MTTHITTKTKAETDIADAHHRGQGDGVAYFERIVAVALAAYPNNHDAQVAYIDGFISMMDFAATRWRTR